MNEQRTALRIVLTGKIQNIGYRRWLKSQMETAGLSGWVKNRRTSGPLPSVDMVIEGERSQLFAFLPALLTGNQNACVDSVSILSAVPSGQDGVRILKADEEDRHLAHHAAVQESIQAYSKSTRALSEAIFSSYGNLFRRASLNEELGRSVAESVIVEQLPTSLNSVFKGLKSNAGVSFATEMWSQSRLRKHHGDIGGNKVEYLLEDKENGKRFAEILDLKTVNVRDRYIKLENISFKPGTVVKPARGGGSRAVFVIKSEDEIHDLTKSTRIRGFDALRDAMKVALDRGWARADSWLIEDFVPGLDHGIPTDLKMLTFYGKVAMVQEATRLPTRICYYNRDGEKIRTGRYEDREFDGTGLSPEYIRMAENISLKIPAPFMRIDFYKTTEGPVFGEFTPRPGNFHQFNTQTDRWLGRCFVEARARLLEDFLNGKEFADFKAFARVVKPEDEGAAVKNVPDPLPLVKLDVD